MGWKLRGKDAAWSENGTNDSFVPFSLHIASFPLNFGMTWEIWEDVGRIGTKWKKMGKNQKKIGKN